MSQAMSLKAKIRNIAKVKNISAQVILQNYNITILTDTVRAAAFLHVSARLVPIVAKQCPHRISSVVAS